MYKLFVHSGSENHGCEAIVRTTINILNENVTLFSRSPELDKKYGIDKICKLEFDEQVPINKKRLSWLLASAETKILGKIDLAIKNRHKALIKSVTPGDIFLSIGGDNYCYSGTDLLAAINRNLKRKGAKLVLWGCSVDPDAVQNPEIAEDLAKFDLIVARESISYNVLKKINKNIIQVSDPAFVLETKELTLPNNWIEGNMVGINASPLILQSGKDSETVLKAYRLLIEEILNHTVFGIALIPHVVCKENSDYDLLFKLYEEYKESNRIVLIDDHNCMELKGFIARCRFFVGARTHATIAAYSSRIPTLVLGYSVKSRGIATDLFGTDENYVLPVQTLDTPEELMKHFQWLVQHEEEIKKHLEKVMPDYISKAYLGKEAVEKLL